MRSSEECPGATEHAVGRAQDQAERETERLRARIAELEAENKRLEAILAEFGDAVDELHADVMKREPQPTLEELHARVREVLGDAGWYRVTTDWDGCGDYWDKRCRIEASGGRKALLDEPERACLLHILEQEGAKP